MSEDNKNKAYVNHSQSIGLHGERLIQSPYTHAQTLEALIGNLNPGGKALDIGCGSGYITACLAKALGEKGNVVAIGMT